MPIKYSLGNDHYTDPDTGVMHNLLGIKNSEMLEQAEASFAALRIYELRENPLEGNFDLLHLQSIHHYIFQDIYPWAGQLRSLDIAKEASKFANHLYIPSYGEKLFQELKDEDHLLGLGREAFARRAAYYIAEINALHPFREGNGRAQREFINHLAAGAGYVIAWESAKPEAILNSTIASFHGELSPLNKLISEHMKPRK